MLTNYRLSINIVVHETSMRIYSDYTLVTAIVCNENLKTDQISHSWWRFSHQGWIWPVKKTDGIGLQLTWSKQRNLFLCIFVGINPELSQFLNLWISKILCLSLGPQSAAAFNLERINQMCKYGGLCSPHKWSDYFKFILKLVCDQFVNRHIRVLNS